MRISLWRWSYNPPPFTSLDLPWILVSRHSAQVLDICFTVYLLFDTYLSDIINTNYVITPVVIMSVSAYNEQMHHSYPTMVGIRRGTWFESATEADQCLKTQNNPTSHKRNCRSFEGSFLDELPITHDFPSHLSTMHIAYICYIPEFYEPREKKIVFFSFMDKISIFNMTR